MKSITTYLTFDGNAREAMTFYHQCLGGTLTVQTFGDADPGAPAETRDRVMHARLTMGALMLMASDNRPGDAFTAGNNFAIAIECDDHAEQDRHFTMLSAGGKVNLPLSMMFWGARFGMARDKFGIEWMFNCDTPK